MKIIKPEKLKPGNTIYIVSPASPPLTGTSYERGKNTLKAMGYHVVESKNVHHRELLFAGDATTRADVINRAFKDKSIHAILCAQGGSGTAHVLPFINFSVIAENPKIFVGYSDITALQIAILNTTGLITFQGPMLASDIGRRFPRFTRDNMLAMLTETERPRELKNPSGKEMITIFPGIVHGQLTGGCLSIVAASLGTKYEIDTKDKIIVFEDIEEKPHRIDRYLTQLIQAKKLQQAKGIIFGTFQKCEYRLNDNYYKYGVSVLDIIRGRIESLQIPSMYGLQFGHVSSKLTISLGGYATLDATEKRITVEPAVK
jgi:muramoyltetrapeptide carboxypeptidase